MDGSRWSESFRPLLSRLGRPLVLGLACVTAGWLPTSSTLLGQPPKRRVDPPGKTREAEEKKTQADDSPAGSEPAVPLKIDAPEESNPKIPKPIRQQAAAVVAGDLHAASFQGVTPGKSTAEQVREKLGSPQRTDVIDGTTRWAYEELGPFQSVEIWLEHNTVTAIVAKLAKSVPVDELAGQLKLQRFESVEVKDGREVLGVAYPERGVLFSYDPDEESSRLVLQIALEPLSGEPFWLRAQQTDANRYSRILGDLKAARDFGWEDPAAKWLEVRIRAQLGQFEKARRLVQSLEADTIEHQFLLTWILAQSGDFGVAEEKAKKLREEAESKLLQARGEHLLGNLKAVGINRNLKEAVSHQTNAIRLATDLLKDRDRTRRRAARRLLIDVHLALSHHVAAGPFQDKKEVAVEWWSEAKKLVDDQPVFRRDLELQFHVAKQILAADAALETPVTASAHAAGLKSAGEKLLAAVDDPLFRRRVQRDVGEGLLDAARIYRKLGRFEPALEAAREARQALMAAKMQDARTAYLQGCVEFVLGSIYAVHQKDHAKACGYYDQALLFFAEPLPPTRGDDSGIHGERFVSMGVSFWQHDRKDLAVKLTERGAELMETAAQHGLISKAALAVPYGNLAAMQQALGNQDASENYSRKAAAITPKKSKRR